MNPNLIKLAQLTSDPNINHARIEKEYQKLEQQLSIPEIPGFIYIPSIQKYVAEETIHQGKNWYQTHETLHEQNQQMLTLHEFVEFLKYLKASKSKKHKTILNTIIEARNPRREEWIDADFKIINDKLHILSHHQIVRGVLEAQEEKELRGYCTESKLIDFGDWLQRATPEGLPPEDVKEGSMYYFPPLKDNNSVARFGAHAIEYFLICFGDALNRYNYFCMRPSYKA